MDWGVTCRTLGHSMASSKPEVASHMFKPGSQVEQTGMYRTVHHPEHRKPHTVMLKKDEKFPACRSCDHTVFLLVMAAQHTSEDPDLSDLSN